jgi:N-acetylglucosaminyldiphosphoundecaprenol N-acetyl-beta-D-mannosaminyltransferase
LRAAYPNLTIDVSPAPRELAAEEKAVVVDKISGPDIVWVGLGLLKQERWIAEHLGRIRSPWIVGVGAAFDYHAGKVAWASPILRALELEWLFRLIIQPRLRARRYWWSAVYVVQATFKGLVPGQFLKRRR